jgi:hypothetical protein
MAWYYALNNEQKGPVEQVEFDALLQQGTINNSTLVWREGMATWLPYGQTVNPVSAGEATNAPSAIAGSIICGECGRAFAADQVIKIGNRYICAACKPTVVQKMREGVVSDTEYERIRKEHIKHEASVKSVGLLYFLGAAVLALVGGVGLFAPLGASNRGELSMTAVGMMFIAVAGVQVWAGFGLRQLKSWARIPAGILSGLGLLAFPLGTLINGYILYLLFCKKGTMVFSEQYQQVIAETPHIKYRTSIVVWVLLGLLVVLLAIIMFAVITAGRR